MAHFRAVIKGNRGEASRCSTRNHGIVASINGWNKGIQVDAHVNIFGEDCFVVRVTGGSNARTIPRIIFDSREEVNHED